MPMLQRRSKPVNGSVLAFFSLGDVALLGSEGDVVSFDGLVSVVGVVASFDGDVSVLGAGVVEVLGVVDVLGVVVVDGGGGVCV